MSESPLSDLAQFQVALLHQLRFYLRTWRFLGILAFVAVISAATLSLDLYQGASAMRFATPTAGAFLGSYLGIIGDVMILAAAFLGGDAIAMDFADGTGYLMLTQPVRRSTLLLGRFAAAALSVMAIALSYYVFAVAGSLVFYENVPPTLVSSFMLASLFGTASLAFAFFCSSLFRSPAVSMIVTALALIVGLPTLQEIGEVTGVEPFYSVNYAGELITQVFSKTFSHETVQKVGGIVFHVWYPYLWEGLAIMVGYLLIFLALSDIVYRHKELRG